METAESMKTVNEYASIGRRIVAYLLDILILIIPCALANAVIPAIGGFLVSLLYAPIFESSALKATIGKNLMGIQVVDLNGRRLTFKSAIVRYLLKFISSILLFIPFFAAFFNPRRQTMHDLLADSVVIYGRSDEPILATWTENLKKVFSEDFGLASETSTLSQLERLQKLRERGAITEEEFQAQKAKILSRM